MSQEEEVKITRTDNSVPNVKTTVTHWKKIVSSNKIYIGVYLLISVLTCCQFSYTDAKTALLKYRNGNSSVLGEYEYVYKNINYFDNFCYSLFFPWTLFGKIIPSLVIWLNPK